MTDIYNAAQQLLEDLDNLRCCPINDEGTFWVVVNEADDALRAALEQKAEPVAEVINERGEVDYISHVPKPGTLLYTTPQPLTGGDDRRHVICLCPDCTTPQPAAWVGLTTEEISESVDRCEANVRGEFLVEFTRAIEAKLREKNGGAHDDTALLRQALEALDPFSGCVDDDGCGYCRGCQADAALAALRERLK